MALASTRRALAAFFLLCLATLGAACLDDEADITTPLVGPRETSTEGPEGPDSGTGTSTPSTGPQLAPGGREQLQTLLDDLAATFCEGECGEGFGQTDAATAQGGIPDLAVPAATPEGTRLASAFVAPTASGDEATSVEDTTVVLLYVSNDGSSWLQLAQGPDTRTAPLTGEELELGPTTTAVIQLDDIDNTAGEMEWATSGEVLFQLTWEGLERDSVVDFAETAAGGGE